MDTRHRLMAHSLSLSLLLLAATGPTARADILRPGMRSIPYCAKIENMEHFPDVVFVGVIQQVTGGGKVEGYFIKPGECLHKGYKFNTFQVFAVPREHAVEINLNASPPHPTALPLSEKIDPVNLQVDQGDPDDAVEETYHVLGFAEDKVVVYKASRHATRGFLRPDLRETYPAPTVPALRSRLAKP